MRDSTSEYISNRYMAWVGRRGLGRVSVFLLWMDFTLLPPDKRWVSANEEIEELLGEILSPSEDETPSGRLTPPTPPEAKRMRMFLEGEEVLSELEALPCPDLLSMFEKTDQPWDCAPKPLPDALVVCPSVAPAPEAASDKWPYPHAGLFREYGGVKAFIEKEMRRMSVTETLDTSQ